MKIDEILRRNDEIIAGANAVIRRGEELVTKLESGQVKPDDPLSMEIYRQLIERRRITAEFNAELTRLLHEQGSEPEPTHTT